MTDSDGSLSCCIWSARVLYTTRVDWAVTRISTFSGTGLGLDWRWTRTLMCFLWFFTLFNQLFSLPQER